MATNDVPGSVRVRTDEGNEWRYDSIQKASDFYKCNRSDSVAFACEDVVRLCEAVETVLSRDDLTQQQRREIADEFSARGVSFSTDLDISVDRD